VGSERTYLDINKAIYEKPTANIILNGEKLRAFPLTLGTRQGRPLSLLLFNIVLKALATQKLVPFLYTNYKIAEREIKETIPFTTASKIIKHLGINVTREVKNLYSQNYEMLIKKN